MIGQNSFPTSPTFPVRGCPDKSLCGPGTRLFIQETPRAPEDTRGDQERRQKDRRAHGGCKKHQEPGGPGVYHGGIGAGRRATGIQHPQNLEKTTQAPHQALPGTGTRAQHLPVLMFCPDRKERTRKMQPPTHSSIFHDASGVC
jgi:hypothetical protein